MENWHSRALGVGRKSSDDIVDYLHIKLAAAGCTLPQDTARQEFLEVAQDLIQNHLEKSRVLNKHLCPADRRIQDFIDKVSELAEDAEAPQLPGNTLVLDRHGLARELALPMGKDEHESSILNSHRLHQGVLHNPLHDRRTTKGSFHIADLGPLTPADKKLVPVCTFVGLLRAALTPPGELLAVPYSQNFPQPFESFVSLLLRPPVCPEVPGHMARKSLEVRFFAPGSMVSNLDFVESIFGNAGDPNLLWNDAALDVDGWTGHTGCVILAPQMTRLRKKDLGLPKWADATERQRHDGMCWKEEDELYNEGTPFKITCRTTAGVVVTLIADNYFGYCKKEVKTQISMSANMFGFAEEEHAGGAVAFPRYHLGDSYSPGSYLRGLEHSFKAMRKRFSAQLNLQPEGHAVDKKFPNLVLVPEDAYFSLIDGTITWVSYGQRQTITLDRGCTYMYPSGFRIHLEKHPDAPSWRLVGTRANGTFCHKPCTVSGGGKSEISKSYADCFVYSSFFLRNFEEDMKLVDEIIRRDYSDRFDPDIDQKSKHRALLSPDRSLGSVIKLLTPAEPDFRPEYNEWLRSIPDHIRALVFFVKRMYRPEWGDNWQTPFSTDLVNGNPGLELKYNHRKVVTIHARVGLVADGGWRTYKLRQDFIAADKLQTEDDISASVVVPSRWLGQDESGTGHGSRKLVENCEYRFFQRPDEAINRGFDNQAEQDLSSPYTFLSNYEALPAERARDFVSNTVEFFDFTAPMREFISGVADSPDGPNYFALGTHPRVLDDGTRTKNPRYLQLRPDLSRPAGRYMAEMAVRLKSQLGPDDPMTMPVDSVLCGRRNNPPEGKVRALAVYSPIHYQELPELFMDFICSLTGKSPSTTGAGSEGALTKAPFNCLPPIVDLNNALVSYILTGDAGFSSSAGHVGPDYRVDHDISLLIPEIWCRMSPEEREPTYMIANDFLERVEDFEHASKQVPASRLGWRVTEKFLRYYLGRMFDTPTAVFPPEMLRPETQDLQVFVDGIANIVETQQRVAALYFEDGGIEGACPPLRALLTIMAHGEWEGNDVHAPEVRSMFSRDYLLNSDWYAARLDAQQRIETARLERGIKYLKRVANRRAISTDDAAEIKQRLGVIRAQLKQVNSAAYREDLVGALGVDPWLMSEEK